MLRDKSLIPLSHQHQRALALCVRIDRAQPIPPADAESWQSEIQRHFEEEINIHFSAEEGVLFPSARRFPELLPLLEELIADHATLRKWFEQAAQRTLSTEQLPEFAQQLSNHIRKEERQLFERLQELMKPEELADLGSKLDAGLQDATHACALTSQATQLKPKR